MDKTGKRLYFLPDNTKQRKKTPFAWIRLLPKSSQKVSFEFNKLSGF